MRTLAVLPVKRFDKGKSRLAAELSDGPRRALAEAMFTDVLTALRRTRTVDRILVITTDASAELIAGGYGATVLEDAGDGHSEAATLGVAHSIEMGAERVLLVPGDCPLLSPDELTALLADPVSAEPEAIVVPDRHGGGTNALLLTPPGAMAPSFGPGSRERHLRLASEQGAAGRVVDVPTLALDVDTPEDLAALQTTLASTRGGAAHTRGMLNQLMRSRS